MLITRQANQEAVLAEFQEYVLDHLPPGVHLSGAQARDHGAQVLDEISARMRKDVSAAASSNDTPAEQHGSARHAAGFDVDHVLGEYRKLRATIMRMWLKSRPPLGASGAEDVVRFNEVLDEALLNLSRNSGRRGSTSDSGSVSRKALCGVALYSAAVAVMEKPR